MKNIKKILIVEDNEINQDLIAVILQKAGYDIIQAYNGYKALELLETNEIDIIFMDIQMPGIDGFETTKLIRNNEETKDIIIVAMTAFISDENENENVFMEAGMDYYIPKPLKIKEVISLLEEIKGNEDLDENEKVKLIEKSNEIVNIPELLYNMADNEELMDKTIKIMLNSYAEKLEKIEIAIANDDFIQLQTSAHSFKGSIGILSKSVYEIALLLEKESQTKSKDNSKIIFNDLVCEMEKVSKFLKEYIDMKNRIEEVDKE